MSLQELRSKIPDFARDIKLNLETLLSPEGAQGLTLEQTSGVSLACAYSVQAFDLALAIRTDLPLSMEYGEAAKGAAAMMAMNNVYYRSIHLIQDSEIKKMPARLRMNFIGKPGIPKLDFELMCLGISAISGCGMCLNAHLHEVKKQGISDEGVQTVLRIASVINATKQALSLV